MPRGNTERRLRAVSSRLKRLRADLVLAEEQLLHLSEDADEARLRSLVSETPVAGQEHRQADRHAVAMRRHRDELVAEIERLDREMDELLDGMGTP